MKIFNTCLNATLIILASVAVLCGGDLTATMLTQDEVVWVQKQLTAAEKGKYNPDELEDPEIRRRIMVYYLAKTNPIPLKAKLMISSCFAWEKRYPEAIKLAEEYSQVYTNDWDGLALLGRTLLESGAYGRAIPVLTNAAARINTNDVEVAARRRNFTDALLAEPALLSGRSEILGQIAPRLIAAKKDQSLPEPFELSTTLALASFAIGTRDERLFVNTVGIMDVGRILSDPDLRTCVRLGCYVFASKGLAPVNLAFRDAAEKDVRPSGEHGPISITTDEAESIERLLKDHADGKVDIYVEADPELCRQLVAYYLTTTNAIHPQVKLAISRCFGMGGYHPEAIKLAKEYLQVYSNDWRGWRIIGLACIREGAYGQACAALTNAVAIGGTDAPDTYSMLATSALMSGRLDIVKNLEPTMLKLKRTDGTDAGIKSELTFELIYYAIATNNKELFVKALEDVTAEQILEERSLRTALFIGWNYFQPSEVEQLWQAFQRAAVNEGS